MSRFLDRAPEESAHKLWLALVPKAGLVVSAPALVRAQVIAPTDVAAEQRELLKLVVLRARDAESDPEPTIADFRVLACTLLDWTDKPLVEAPESLAVPLPAYQDELRASHAVPDPVDPSKWRLLVHILPTFTDFDAAPDATEAHGWRATPQERFERLLRESGVSAGLLFNGTSIRLVFAPKGETSGYLTLEFLPMTRVDGRPILGGLLCLLNESVVFSRDKGQSLNDLLVESRKYQATVSNALAGQVLGALHELLRGLQLADKASAKADRSRMLDTMVPEHMDELYGGLVHVLMRLVFILFAEDRGLMPSDPVYADNYSVVGLFERPRADHALYADTMDQRFGAWAHLTSLFRLVHDGGKHAGLDLPERNGDLFNPDRYPFLEGRPFGVNRVMEQRFDPPKIPDGVIWEVLQRLLLHEGERLSYRTLDVEQIGSVYEAIMGFGVERATGPALGLKPKNVFVNLDALLALPGDKRAAFVDAEAGCKLPPAATTALAAAKTPVDAAAALSRQVSEYARNVLPPMTLYLQPGEERRRSGSHYTPRELTSPIVATTLRPVLEALGPNPTPEQILSLKVCDPAMGSGAFLVEACRQLGERLVEAWNVHGLLPTIPPDEEPYLHARRIVAKRCLYGVDKNPLAASLAKLSLWLVTLAKDHRFSFLNHALKHGDSLVGYTRQQIFMFNPRVTGSIVEEGLFAGLVVNLGKAKANREFIQTVDEDTPAGGEIEVREHFDEAEYAMRSARFKGDLLVAAFFGAANAAGREALRVEYKNLWDDSLGEGSEARVALESGERVVKAMRTGQAGKAVVPFHWEIEFPEVFDRGNPGFDCFVGNPPFMGKNTISLAQNQRFPDWLATFPETHGNADLVIYFFRRAFTSLRPDGCMGLIATNTIAQGDTRRSGLRWIVRSGGTVFAATRRLPWPGAAAVIVSTVHVRRGSYARPLLNGVDVDGISAYLVPGAFSEDPETLGASGGMAFTGPIVLGMGFTFDDDVAEATPVREMERILLQAPECGIGANIPASTALSAFVVVSELV